MVFDPENWAVAPEAFDQLSLAQEAPVGPDCKGSDHMVDRLEILEREPAVPGRAGSFLAPAELVDKTPLPHRLPALVPDPGSVRAAAPDKVAKGSSLAQTAMSALLIIWQLWTFSYPNHTILFAYGLV